MSRRPNPRFGGPRLRTLGALVAALWLVAAAPALAHRHHRWQRCWDAAQATAEDELGDADQQGDGDQRDCAAGWELRPWTGGPFLSDALYASLVRPADETRPDNAPANATEPTEEQLADFHAASGEPYSDRVTGGFTGTTDEIIQWAAWKWGVDANLMRAAAMQESDWHQGDVSDGGVSFGLFSVKTQLAGLPAGWAGT